MEAVLERFRTQLVEGEPSDRSFGFLAAALLSILGFRHWWMFAAGAAIAVVAVVTPQILRVPKRAWLFAGFLMSLIVNPLLLGILFFGILTPAGLLMRAVGHDPLRLKPSPKLPTYWIQRTAPGSDMNEQF